MTPYTAEFFAFIQAQTRSSAEVVVPRVIELTSAESVVDVGCGTGTWLSVFREQGVEDVLGVDGEYIDESALEIPRELFRAHDLAEPLALSRRFDLVLSLEVAEHLPENSAANFVATLTSLGPIVLFSAAIPGQGGTNHVNEQWPGYWAELFHAHDYVHVDCFRRKLWHDESVARWYAQNLLLYVTRDELARHAALAALYDPEETRPLDLVHPTRYLDWFEFGRWR